MENKARKLNNRPGNKLPKVSSIPNSLGRESILYKYHNTVKSSYVGDIRHITDKFKNYLTTKNAYYDPIKNEYISFPIRYAAPNLVFSDDKGITGNAPEASLKDRIVLPIISFYLSGMEYDPKRAIDPCVRYRYKPDTTESNSAMVSTAPKAMNYSFQVDLWTESRESYYQILTAFQLDFNPYSYLVDLYDYEDETQKTFYAPYAKMTLDSYSDSSNFVPGTDRRVVRGTLKITVEAWLTQPPTNEAYLFNVNAISPDGEPL